MAKLVLSNLPVMEYSQREAYNSLRSNIQFCGADIKKIMFTSCGVDEGKSTICFGIARSFAKAGKKVVIVDADMRKSVTVSRYNIDCRDNAVGGLSHYLSGQKSFEEVVHETNVENLNLVISGPYTPNPSQLIESQVFDGFIKKLDEQFDIIIVDTPPLGAVIDAAIIATKCDGSVLVIESNTRSRRLLIDVKKQLEASGSRILGTVLNKFDESKNSYYYHSKYGKYSKYCKYYRYY